MWPGYWEPGVRQCPHVMVGRSPRPVFAVDCFLHPFNIIIIFFHINLIIIWWDTVCSTCAHNERLARRCEGRLKNGEASFFGGGDIINAGQKVTLLPTIFTGPVQTGKRGEGFESVFVHKQVASKK